MAPGRNILAGPASARQLDALGLGSAWRRWQRQVRGTKCYLLLLRGINKLNAEVITRVEPGLQGLWLAGGALFELKDCLIRGFRTIVRNSLERGDKMHPVSVVNCNESAIVGIQQFENVGARGKHFPRNLNGFVDSHNRFLI